MTNGEKMKEIFPDFNLLSKNWWNTEYTGVSSSKNQNKWIPISEYGYPKLEDEYKRFLTIDNKGEITIQEFLLSLDKEPVPYFTGWRNIVAYMPLPQPYKGESEK